jgi:hypothetical protein
MYKHFLFIDTGDNGISYAEIQEKEALMAQTANFFDYLLAGIGNYYLIYVTLHI